MPRSPGRTGSRWRKVRAQVIEEEPTCRLRLDARCTVISTTADHIVPLKYGGDPLDRANLQGACGHCNTVKENRSRRKRPPRRNSRDW